MVIARPSEQVGAPLTPAVVQRANAVPLSADLGSCVLVSLSGGWSRAAMTQEGVVIEVVLPGAAVRSARAVHPRANGSSRSAVIRYVVQCWTCRVLRRAAEMIVVSL